MVRRTLERTLNIFVCLCNRNFWSTETNANQTKHTKATTEKLVDVYDDGGGNAADASAYAHTDIADAAVAVKRTSSNWRARHLRHVANELLLLSRDCTDKRVAWTQWFSVHRNWCSWIEFSLHLYEIEIANGHFQLYGIHILISVVEIQFNFPAGIQCPSVARLHMCLCVWTMRMRCVFCSTVIVYSGEMPRWTLPTVTRL